MAAVWQNLSFRLAVACQFTTHHREFMPNETKRWQDNCNKTAVNFRLIAYGIHSTLYFFIHLCGPDSEGQDTSETNFKIVTYGKLCNVITLITLIE